MSQIKWFLFVVGISNRKAVILTKKAMRQGGSEVDRMYECFVVAIIRLYVCLYECPWACMPILIKHPSFRGNKTAISCFVYIYIFELKSYKFFDRFIKKSFIIEYTCL
jgi:hypothetical protein